MRNFGLLLAPWAVAVAMTCVGLGCGSDDDNTNPADNTGGTGGAAGTGGTGGAAGTGGEAGTGGTGGSSPEDRKVVLLFTSDEHSNLLSFSPELDDFPLATTAGTGTLTGGVARRAALLKEQRDAAAAQDIPTVTVSAGDNAMGTLSQIARTSAATEWRMMHELGYDATTLGNHDFDLGLDSLTSALDVARAAGELPPIISSNIHFSADSADDDALAAEFSDTPTDDAAIHPRRVIELANGLKVGIVGYMGVDAAWKAPFKSPVAFSESAVAADDQDDPVKVLPHLYTELQAQVDKLRNDDKVDLVVALAHAGLVVSDPSISEDDKVAAKVAGIDVIVSGHMHETDEAPYIVENETTHKNVVVLNAGSQGMLVGRIELTVPGDTSQPVTFDAATQGLLPVDDRIVPEPTLAAKMSEAIEDVEKAGSQNGQSGLERLLSRSTGTTVTNDPATAGDLYFYALGSTSFDLAGRALSYLTADAQLALLDDLGLPAQIALQSNGVIRSDLLAGKTGVISAADAFRVVPLGFSEADNSVGYPLVRLKMPVGAIRVLFEFTSGLGEADGSYDITGGGVSVEYDCTREPIASTADIFSTTKGRVMKVWMDSDHSDGMEQFDQLIWDRATATGFALAGDPYVVTTTTYIAQILAGKGATLTDLNDQPVQVQDAIVLRPSDQTEVKELEAFFSYLLAAPVPARYDIASPDRTDRFTTFAFCQ